MARLIDASGVVVFDGTIDGGIEVVRVPITFDLADLVIGNFPVTAVDDGTGTFTIAGDHTALFPAGAKFVVVQSSANDNGYTVDSVSLVTGDTVIVTVEGFGDNTADGVIANTGTAGIVVYTPTPDDLIMQSSSVILLPSPWDGDSPSLHLVCGLTSSSFSNDAEFAGSDTAFGGPFDLSAANIVQTDDVDEAGLINLPNSATLVFKTATPVRAVIENGGYIDPGSAQGEGEIVLVIVKAS